MRDGVRTTHCGSLTVLKILNFCPRHLELFTSFREFGQLFITIVYIHPRANFRAVENIIYDVVDRLENIATDAPKFVSGDFVL